MQEVDSQVLQDVSKILRLSTVGSQITDFDDGVLQQVLDVSKLVRRGGVLAQSQGLFSFEIVNEHAGASTIRTLVNPRSPGAVIQGAGYPAQVPLTLDPWVVAVGIRCAAADAAKVGDCVFAYGMIDDQMGFGPAASAIDIPMLHWDEMKSFGTLDCFGRNSTTDEFPKLTGPVRFSDRSRLVCISVSSDIVDVEFEGIMALLPAGLGQDAIGAG